MKSRPLEFIVEHTKHQVEQLDEYRMRILRGVKTFAGFHYPINILYVSYVLMFLYSYVLYD